jgi:hypothetical protein
MVDRIASRVTDADGIINILEFVDKFDRNGFINKAKSIIGGKCISDIIDHNTGVQDMGIRKYLSCDEHGSNYAHNLRSEYSEEFRKLIDDYVGYPCGLLIHVDRIYHDTISVVLTIDASSKNTYTKARIDCACRYSHDIVIHDVHYADRVDDHVVIVNDMLSIQRFLKDFDKAKYFEFEIRDVNNYLNVSVDMLLRNITAADLLSGSSFKSAVRMPNWLYATLMGMKICTDLEKRSYVEMIY